jgi:hypothetical protein
MQTPAAKIRVSCNESFDAHEENRDLEGRHDDNKLRTKDTAAFGRTGTLLDEIR